MSIIAHWFKRRRSTAMGVVGFASSIGSTLFPVAFHNLNITVGCVQIVFYRPTFLVELIQQIQMVHEDHRIHPNVRSRNYEFGT